MFLFRMSGSDVKMKEQNLYLYYDYIITVITIISSIVIIIIIIINNVYKYL